MATVGLTTQGAMVSAAVCLKIFSSWCGFITNKNKYILGVDVAILISEKAGCLFHLPVKSNNLRMSTSHDVALGIPKGVMGYIRMTSVQKASV